MRILVVEDEKNLNDIIVKKLKNEKYGVDSCFDGKDAIDYILATEYDVIILDIMLPKLNGFEVLKSIRNKNIKTPVLMLTAKDGIEDKVQGLDLGADDYLIKPFSFDELLARIRVLLRRNSTNNNANNIYKIANLTVDIDSRSVFRDDKSIKLSTREFTILEYLIRNKGKVLSRDSIEQHIWDYEYEGGTNVVDVYIRYLRKKIDDGYSPKLIYTIRNIGYVLKVENE
ncbi:MAG: response regulator transcription factor [Leptotrichiaceae bacterium]|nr:response regulator transcription factor [Leptotrichiaceae bacterium]MBP7100868.1 response regulator transcription factor [Leptotrichiaceae bacterium]MBP7739483.1 response regulator transcription factor [Leptotrichiaceae bacterium]MBP9629800.1 response regulator transcription factor [Leptotrichiaceae bacterium]